MTDSDRSVGGPTLAEIFVSTTGEREVTDRQEDQDGKQVINATAGESRAKYLRTDVSGLPVEEESLTTRKD